MRQGDTKLFSDRDRLCQLVNLRLNGYASTSLAIIFNCHRSSVESQLQRYGILPLDTIYTIERIAANVLYHLVPPEPKWEEVDGARFSKGKSYADYLKESQFKRTVIRII